MALMIMGSSGGCCGRSGSALPDITMHAGAGARGASSVSATNILRSDGPPPPQRRGEATRTHAVDVTLLGCTVSAVPLAHSIIYLRNPSAAVWSIPHRGYCSSFLINYFRQKSVC